MTSSQIPVDSKPLSRTGIYSAWVQLTDSSHLSTTNRISTANHISTANPHQTPTVSLLHHPRIIIMSGNSNDFCRTSVRDSFNPADNFRGQSRPEHHLHRESELLPGSDPMAYSQDQMEDSGMWENRRDIGTPFIHSFNLNRDVGTHHDRPFARRCRHPPRDAGLRHPLIWPERLQL